MALLRSILFTLLFYGGTTFAVIFAFPASWCGRRVLRRYVLGWALFHRACTRLLGIITRIEGAIPTGAVLVAAKHQSMYETIELLALLGEPAVVVKRELADIPGWGKAALRYGIIPVDREAGGAALRRMLRAARAAQGEGRSILIFPEGTRVLPGEQPPLRPGFAGLYRQLGLPVVPVALDSGRLWPRRSFVKRAGTVTFRFGEAIPPGLPRDEAETRVHTAINALEA